MRNLGLRLRVALAFTVAFSLIVCALGFTLFTAFEEMEDTLVERILSDEVNFLVERLRENPRIAPSRNPHLSAYVVRAPADKSSLPAFMRNLGVGQHEVFEIGNELHITVRDVPDGRLYVAYDVSLFQQREQQFLILLGLSMIAVIVVSLTLGYWLSGILVKQVTTLAETVDKLAPGEMRKPLAQPGQEAEVAQLARAFDNYQTRLDMLLHREQEFTANASHELRTPLTAIRTSCELLVADPAITGKSQQRLTAIAAAALRMTDQIEMLLLLGREQAPGAIEPVGLAAIVDDAVEAYRAEITRRGLRLELDVAANTALRVNPHALHLVLANLIRNAVRHTTQGFIRVEYRDNRIIVSDSGSGIAEEHLPRVFDRYYRASADGDGAGLGLAIVRRICDRCGWTIALQSAPASGTRFTLSIAASADASVT